MCKKCVIDWLRRLLCLSVVLLESSCLALTAGAETQTRPVLRVGIGQLAAGYEEQDDAGIYYGKDTDYMVALASYAGYDVQFCPASSWDEELQMLENGDVDVLAGVIKRPHYRTQMDFSRLPTGVTYSSISMRGGIDAFNRMLDGDGILRLGAVPRQANPFVFEGIRAAGIKYDLREYDSLAAMQAAEDSGEIDGAINNSLLDEDEPDRVAAFGILQEYFAVRKGNTELLHKLDMAADQLAVNRPMFTMRLFSQYHLRKSTSLLLTKSEREYLQMRRCASIKAVAVARARPYCYVDENGQLAGTVYQIAGQMERDLGITFSYIPVQSYEEAYDIIARGEADILLNSSEDYGHLANYELDATKPYMTVYYTAVARRDRVPDNPLVATFPGYVSRHMLPDLHPEMRTQLLDSPEDCLQAVRDGRADITYLPQDVVQYALLSGDYPELVQYGSVAFYYPICAAVSKHCNVNMLTILDKEINHIGPQAVMDIASQHDRQVTSQRSLKSLLYAYPERFVAGILIFGSILALLGWRLFVLRRRHFAEVQQLIYQDPNTGRPNRRWFDKRCRELLLRRKAEEINRMAVVVLSIPRLSTLQSTYGSETVLSLFGHLSDKLDGEQEWIQTHAINTGNGRLSVLTRPIEAEKLEARVRAFLKAQEYIHVGKMSIHVGIRVGICWLRDVENDIHHATNNAYIAAQMAHPILFFNHELQEKEQLHNRMESAQQQALEREEFAVWYQPKYDLVTHQCIGAEALVRWTSPELGFLPPGEFISLFESNGFITQLDFYMLEHVMAFQKAREEAGLPVVPISVNQSRLHMQERGYLKHMRQMVQAYDIKDEVALELLESAFDFATEQQREHALAVVTALKGMGFAIDMDDFGSGYSDLSLLNYLPLDVMKLDRSMLLASENSERMQQVIAHMIDLGHVLNMKVICEGIETTEQEQMLRDLNCDYGQGYLYSKPLPEDKFTEFLREHICANI